MLLMRNDNMGFFVPDQGSNVWTDGMVITKKCKSTKLAHQFIDYFLNYDVAEQNTDYIGYDSAVKVCMNILKMMLMQEIRAVDLTRQILKMKFLKTSHRI